VPASDPRHGQLRDLARELRIGHDHERPGRRHPQREDVAEARLRVAQHAERVAMEGDRLGEAALLGTGRKREHPGGLPRWSLR
jgi:hypothetical protein